MRTICVSCLLVCVFTISAGSSYAELLNLTVEHYPRVYSTFVQVDYDPAGAGANGLLEASGWTWDLYEDETSMSWPIYSGEFLLSVEIDKATGQGVSGSLDVTGDPYGPLETLFYSTTLTAFGYGGDDLFECLFTQEGSGLPPVGEPIGIIMNAVSIDDLIFSEGVEPGWDVAFSNGGDGYSNAFYLPEPSSMALLGLAGLGLISRRRIRRR